MATQRDWDKPRDRRPDILFEFKKPVNLYNGTKPGWIWDTHVSGYPCLVIDTINNKPLRAFGHVPITVSTNVEGWLQEAWFREDADLEAEDLIQRMPYTAEHNVYGGRKIINRLVRRRELFRDEGRCLSWKKSNWTKKWDKHLIEEMEANPDETNPNSTRHLKDLTKTETKTFKAETYASGKNLRKAGDRALERGRREEKDREVKETLRNNPIKTTRTTLHDNEEDDLDEEQTQHQTETFESTGAESLEETQSVQLPQQHTHSGFIAVNTNLMTYPRQQSVSHPIVTNSVTHQQANTSQPANHPDCRGPSGGLPTVVYLTHPLVSTICSQVHPAHHLHYADGAQRQFMNNDASARMPPYHQQPQQTQREDGRDVVVHVVHMRPRMWILQPDSHAGPQRAFSHPSSSSLGGRPTEHGGRSCSCPSNHCRGENGARYGFQSEPDPHGERQMNRQTSGGFMQNASTAYHPQGPHFSMDQDTNRNMAFAQQRYSRYSNDGIVSGAKPNDDPAPDVNPFRQAPDLSCHADK